MSLASANEKLWNRLESGITSPATKASFISGREDSKSQFYTSMYCSNHEYYAFCGGIQSTGGIQFGTVNSPNDTSFCVNKDECTLNPDDSTWFPYEEGHLNIGTFDKPVFTPICSDKPSDTGEIMRWGGTGEITKTGAFITRYVPLSDDAPKHCKTDINACQSLLEETYNVWDTEIVDGKQVPGLAPKAYCKFDMECDNYKVALPNVGGSTTEVAWNDLAAAAPNGIRADYIDKTSLFEAGY